MKKPSVSKRRATGMAVLAALIACHPAMGVFELAFTASNHTDKIDQLREGTYSIGRAAGASVQTFIEGALMGGLVAFLFTLPIALLFGLSTHVLLIKSGFWKMRHYALAGAFMGTVAYIYFLNATQAGLGISFPTSLHLLVGTFTGLIAAVMFRVFMGNNGAVDQRPATWHSNLFKTASLPQNMPFKPVAVLCIGSGLLLIMISFSVGVITHLAANFITLFFAMFSEGSLGPSFYFDAPIEPLFNPMFLPAYMAKFAVASVLFSGIYIVLRWLKKTGWIAFALAGLIGGPIIYLETSILPTYGIYGRSVSFAPYPKLIEGVILAAFLYALTAIVFRALLGRIAAKHKGRSISAPAS